MLPILETNSHPRPIKGFAGDICCSLIPIQISYSEKLINSTGMKIVCCFFAIERLFLLQEMDTAQLAAQGVQIKVQQGSGK
jgi:hypothetical protein